MIPQCSECEEGEHNAEASVLEALLCKVAQMEAKCHFWWIQESEDFGEVSWLRRK